MEYNKGKQKNRLMTKESIGIVYEANNIKFERCELYNDFVQSLLRLIFDTYMGDEVTDSKNRIKHFKWCWNKNVENFKTEGISFNDDKLYEYFLAYVNEVYYNSEKKIDESINKEHLNMWHDLFNYNKEKTNYELDTLVEVYKIFEKSHKNIQ